ncbi:MAG: prepilin-type N-terminal cleavage/methylation domain-containing protein [Sedimentisphaerales bacterium]|nr:prepilin-type N-terminal cleavage/methylation domain-containing protein [Sedimentisphaerales bacterium]
MELIKRNNKAFTLIELLVAMGIFVIVISFSGQIFKVCIESHRTALANADIMQKLRAITNQLNSDFKGLDKNGEIFVVWKAVKMQDDSYIDNDLDGYERFDRIMFFAEGDFQTYSTGFTSNNSIRGNVARICYTIAKNGEVRPEQLDKPDRILARTQHILTDDETLPDINEPNNFTPEKWIAWNNTSQYDKISLEQWKNLPLQEKIDILSIICDIEIIGASEMGVTSVNENLRGISVEPNDPDTLHMLLCEGVGEFKIQGWDDTTKTWVPEVDSHFNTTDSNSLPGVLYPWPLGAISIEGNNYKDYPRNEINREHFNSIPGLGRALKFTFTLFDSKGIIKGGRTFTHIVYLDN